MAAAKDVALIIFVPFTFTALGLMGADAGERLTVPMAVLLVFALVFK